MIGTKSSYSMSLSNKIIALVSITILVALFASAALIIPRLNNIFIDKLGSNAMSVATIVSSDKHIVNWLDEGSQSSMKTLKDSITLTARATNTNIAILDLDKKPIIEYTTNKAAFNQQLNLAIEGSDKAAPEVEVQNARFLTYSLLPIKDDNELIGYVVVAFLEDPTNNLTSSTAMLVFLTNIIGLLVGLTGAVFTAQSIKSVMLGMEPDEISKVMQEQEAILNSVREGVIATDSDCNITLLNDEAVKIISSSNKRRNYYVGKSIGTFFSVYNFRNTIIDGRERYNITESIQGFNLLLNILPITVNDKVVGTVTTFRKRTDMEELAEELTGVKNYADALRANTHEFMNKLHAIMGLVEIKAYDELRNYIKQLANYQQEEVTRITSMIDNAVLSGFILGKLNRAKELDIEFILTDDSKIAKNDIDNAMTHKIILIVGNIISNAYDVLVQNDCEEKIVFLTIRTFDKELFIIIEDSGPGIPDEIRENIFEKNFSTKGHNRGIGLYLVKQTVEELQGAIEIDSIVGEGTIFTVKFNIH